MRDLDNLLKPQRREDPQHDFSLKSQITIGMDLGMHLRVSMSRWSGWMWEM